MSRYPQGQTRLVIRPLFLSRMFELKPCAAVSVRRDQEPV